MRRIFQSLSRLILFSWVSIVLILGLLKPAYATDIYVIANSSSGISHLSRSEIRQMYLGGSISRTFDPVALTTNNSTRTLFNTKVLGLTEGRVQSYWAQLLFSGKSIKPPQEFDQETDVISYVKSHDKAIGYVSSKLPIPTNVTIIYRK